MTFLKNVLDAFKEDKSYHLLDFLLNAFPFLVHEEWRLFILNSNKVLPKYYCSVSVFHLLQKGEKMHTVQKSKGGGHLLFP